LDGFCLIVSIVKAQATHNTSHRAKKAGHHWSAFFTPHNAPNSKEAGPPTPAFLFVVPKCPSIDLAVVRLNGSGSTVAAEIAEDLIKIKWHKLSKIPFALSHRKLDLLEAEFQPPGRAVSYIIKAKKALAGEA
jgi:hypothetical protein